MAGTRLSIRIDLENGDRIGPGKVALLEAIRASGSISAAARTLGMSYRRAWLLVDALNRLFGEPVVETKHGGPAGGGAQLTPLGHRLVHHYRAIEAKAQAAGAGELAELAAAARDR
jgi:molybdate transport system regulatory protein